MENDVLMSDIKYMLDAVEKTDVNTSEDEYQDAIETAILYFNKKPTNKMVKAVLLYGEEAKILVGHI